jgi:hypothetical protein
MQYAGHFRCAGCINTNIRAVGQITNTLAFWLLDNFNSLISKSETWRFKKQKHQRLATL